MRKFLLICFSALFLSTVYVTPLWGREDVTNNIVESDEQELEIKEIKTNEIFTLYAGVEEAFDINKNNGSEVYKDTTVYSGWVTTRLNIRKEPSLDSEVLNILEFNESINYQIYDKRWVVINYNNKPAYVYRIYISENENDFKEHSVPNNTGFKSYMSYKAITSKNSKQYKLQKNYAYTGNYGIRMVYNRCCIAVGTHFNIPVGNYVDLVLENETTIPCIVAEIKSNNDTNEDNITTSHNGCVAEFIVDTESLNENAKRDGDISSCKKEWDSPVTRIKVYNRKIL